MSSIPSDAVSVILSFLTVNEQIQAGSCCKKWYSSLTSIMVSFDFACLKKTFYPVQDFLPLTLNKDPSIFHGDMSVLYNEESSLNKQLVAATFPALFQHVVDTLATSPLSLTSMQQMFSVRRTTPIGKGTIEIFLETYQSFATPEQVLSYIIHMFTVEYAKNTKENMQRIKALCQMFELWFKYHMLEHFAFPFHELSLVYRPKESDAKIIVLLQQAFDFVDKFFINSKEQTMYLHLYGINIKNECEKHLKVLQKTQTSFETKKKNTVEMEKKTTPKFGQTALLDLYSPEEVACQLTLRECNLFFSFKTYEFCGKKWRSKQFDMCPNLSAMLEQFDKLAQWV
jgi:hypothetical protein